MTEDDNKAYEEKQELKTTLGLMGGNDTELNDEDGWTQAAKEHIFSKGPDGNGFGTSYTRLSILQM